MEKLRKIIILFVWLLVVTSVALLFFGLKEIYTNQRFFHSAEKVEGTVLSNMVSNSADRYSYYNYLLTVQFTTKTGQTVTFESDTAFGDNNVKKTGEKVDVYYNINNPNQARIADSGTWLPSIVLTVVGLVSGLGALLLILLSKIKLFDLPG